MIDNTRNGTETNINIGRFNCDKMLCDRPKRTEQFDKLIANILSEPTSWQSGKKTRRYYGHQQPIFAS